MGVVDHVGRRLLRDGGLTLSTGFQRSFAGDGHRLTIDLTRSRDAPRERTIFFDLPESPAGPLEVRDLLNDSTLILTDFKVAYARPLAAGAKLDVGYELRVDDDGFENLLVTDPSLALAEADPTPTNRFKLKQAVHSRCSEPTASPSRS